MRRASRSSCATFPVGVSILTQDRRSPSSRSSSACAAVVTRRAAPIADDESDWDNCDAMSARHPVETKRVLCQDAPAHPLRLGLAQPSALDRDTQDPLERLTPDACRQPENFGLARLIGSVQHFGARRGAEQYLELLIDGQRSPGHQHRHVQVHVRENRGNVGCFLDPGPAGVNENDWLHQMLPKEWEEILWVSMGQY